MSAGRLEGARIVVTGGAGFIGSHLVDALLRGSAPAAVTVVDDLSTGSADNVAQWADDARFALDRSDVRDHRAMADALRGADVVFHLACLGVRHSLHSPVLNHAVNADGALAVGLAARDAGVGLLVHVSSSEVFGTAQRVPMDELHPTWPETVYGAGKLAGEAIARAMQRTYGVPVIVARPFNTYGPRSHHEGDSGEIIPRTIVRVLGGQAPVVFGDGLQTRDFMHVADTADGLIRLAEAPEAVGRTVNLGTGREVTMLHLCELIARAAGRPDLVPQMLPGRPGDVRRLLVDNALMQELTGWTPSRGLADGITDLVQWFRACGRSPDELLAEVEDTNWTPADARDAVPS